MKLLFTLSIFVLSIYCQAQDIDSLFQKGNTGIGFDFGPCTGIGFAYGEAAEYVDEECFMNMGLLFIHKKIHYVARLTAQTGGLQKTLPYDSLWSSGNSFQSTNYEAAIGYHLMDRHRFNVVPFVNGGIKSIVTRNQETDYKASLKKSAVIGVSLAIDYKIHFPVKEKNAYPGSTKEQQYFYIRLIGGLYPGYYQNQLDIRGGLSYINLTIGGNYIPKMKKK